ncbi:hypothetical protein FQZ97_726550 [compost metagenome]
MVEIARAVEAAQVLGGYPLATALDHELSRGTDRAQATVSVVHLHPGAGHRLAQGAAHDSEIRCTGVADENHPDLGRAVHAADLQAEGLLHEVRRLVVDGLTGERQLFEGIAVAAGDTAVLHHAVVRCRRRHVGEAVFRQRLQQPLGLEASAVGPDREAQRQRRQSAVPQPVPPRRGRGAEEAVSRAQTGAVQRRHHQGDQGAVRMFDCVRQFAGGA